MALSIGDVLTLPEMLRGFLAMRRQDSSEAIGAMGCENQPLVPAVMKA